MIYLLILLIDTYKPTNIIFCISICIRQYLEILFADNNTDLDKMRELNNHY